jgi:hypothetical protein
MMLKSHAGDNWLSDHRWRDCDALRAHPSGR